MAVEAHRGQLRKDGSSPYVSHPLAVAELLADAGLDEADRRRGHPPRRRRGLRAAPRRRGRGVRRGGRRAGRHPRPTIGTSRPTRSESASTADRVEAGRRAGCRDLRGGQAREPTRHARALRRARARPSPAASTRPWTCGWASGERTSRCWSGSAPAGPGRRELRERARRLRGRASRHPRSRARMIVDCAHYPRGAASTRAPQHRAAAAPLRRAAASSSGWASTSPSDEELERVATGVRPARAGRRGRAATPTSGPSSRTTRRSFFIVLKTARYDDESEEVEFGEIHLFAGPGYVIAVRHGEASELRRRAAPRGAPRPARRGPGRGRLGDRRQGRRRLRPGRRRDRDDIEEVEEEIFRQHGDSTQRIYFLKRSSVLIFFAGTLMTMATMSASVRLGQRMVFDLGADLFAHLQRLSLVFHSRRAVGDTIARVTGDRLRPPRSSSTARCCRCSSRASPSIAMFAVMWHLDPTMTLLAMSRGALPRGRHRSSGSRCRLAAGCAETSRAR